MRAPILCMHLINEISGIMAGASHDEEVTAAVYHSSLIFEYFAITFYT
jgi:hypothetical protein